MNLDPWATAAAAKWDPATHQLHDVDAHKRDRVQPSSWPQCPRCSTLAIEFHDSHELGHLVPADARHRYEQDTRHHGL